MSKAVRIRRWLFVAFALAARREAKIVRMHPAPDVVSSKEARRLYSIRGRIADSIAALRQGASVASARGTTT